MAVAHLPLLLCGHSLIALNPGSPTAYHITLGTVTNLSEHRCLIGQIRTLRPVSEGCCGKRCLWRAWQGAGDDWVFYLALLCPLTCWSGKLRSPRNLRCWWWALRHSRWESCWQWCSWERCRHEDWEGGTHRLVAGVSLQNQEGRTWEVSFCTSLLSPLEPAAHLLCHCHHLLLLSRASLLPLWDSVLPSFSLHLLLKGKELLLFPAHQYSRYTMNSKRISSLHSPLFPLESHWENKVCNCLPRLGEPDFELRLVLGQPFVFTHFTLMVWQWLGSWFMLAWYWDLH